MLKLSELSGIPRTTLQQQINGTAKMTVDVLMAVATALGVEAGDFLPQTTSVVA